MCQKLTSAGRGVVVSGSFLLGEVLSETRTVLNVMEEGFLLVAMNKGVVVFFLDFFFVALKSTYFDVTVVGFFFLLIVPFFLFIFDFLIFVFGFEPNILGAPDCLTRTTILLALGCCFFCGCSSSFAEQQIATTLTITRI
jgi:hypothetical protein